MPDEIENLLQRFQPAGPPASLRDKILASAQVPCERIVRRWPVLFFRTGIASLLLLYFALLHVASTLNRDSALQVGVGPPRWTPEAQQAADLIDPNGNAGRQYIALCLLADNARASRPAQNPSQGDFR